MKILAIETSSAVCSVALLIDDEIISQHEINSKQQSQNILLMIDSILTQKKIPLNQLDAIAFGCGPGSFTGVRIAASIIQSLSFAVEIPIISISSLAALAQTVYNKSKWSRLVVAVDARMQEIYWAYYKVNTTGLVTLCNKEKLSAASDIILPEENIWYGIGNAWQLYPIERKQNLLDTDADSLPSAASVAMLAKAKFLSNEFTDANCALPIYLRNSIAKKSKTS